MLARSSGLARLPTQLPGWRSRRSSDDPYPRYTRKYRLAGVDGGTSRPRRPIADCRTRHLNGADLMVDRLLMFGTCAQRFAWNSEPITTPKVVQRIAESW